MARQRGSRERSLAGGGEESRPTGRAPNRTPTSDLPFGGDRLKAASWEASGSRGNGRECSRRVFEQLTTTSEAYLGLCALGTQGATDVGSYSVRLDELQRTSTSGFGPLGNRGVELLPIPLVLAMPFLFSLA